MVIKDRFAEMQGFSGPQQDVSVEIAPPNYNETAMDGNNEEFFDKISVLKNQVDTLSSQIEQLRLKHNAIINPSADADENALRNQVECANGDIQALAQKTNTLLKKMKLDLDNSKNELQENPNTTSTTKAMLRAQQSHYNSLTRRFKQVMEDYSKTQLDYKERLKNRLKKQLRIAQTDREFEDDEIDQMIESGNMTVFDEGFIQIQQNKQIADELEVRKNEMLNLEHAIRELHALFVEMASLVEEQGEMVNRILDNVNNTEAYVEKAVEDVHQAARYQSSARRKKIWIVILCLIVMAVLALIVFLSWPSK
jgi:t-SNARE complex subunit (syntaxin)